MKQKNLKIVSAGMPRSGSTWLYNAIRLIAIENNIFGDSTPCGWCEDVDSNESSWLIKIHTFDSLLSRNSDFIFYSYRDLRDALASNLRKFSTPIDISLVDTFIEWDNKWRKVADYSMKYEDMLKNPEQEIKNIGKLLGYSGNAHVIIDAIKKLNYDSNGSRNETYNEKNLFHKNHITDGRIGSWKGQIEPELLIEIEDRYKDWFLNNGYNLN